MGSVFPWWLQVSGAGIERRPSLGRSRPNGRVWGREGRASPRLVVPRAVALTSCRLESTVGCDLVTSTRHLGGSGVAQPLGRPPTRARACWKRWKGRGPQVVACAGLLRPPPKERNGPIRLARHPGVFQWAAGRGTAGSAAGLQVVLVLLLSGCGSDQCRRAGV
jgi:hypothetical protein